MITGADVRIPNADQAIVDVEKLRDYCLNPSHPRGRHKARVFAAALGLTSDDAEILRTALLQTVLISEAIEAERDAYGQRYVIDFVMQGPQGQSMVRSAWIIRPGESNPRLVSCYVV